MYFMVSLLLLRVAFHFYAKKQEDSVWLSHTSKTHKQQIAAILRKTPLEWLDTKAKTFIYAQPAVARLVSSDRPCASTCTCGPRIITTRTRSSICTWFVIA